MKYKRVCPDCGEIKNINGNVKNGRRCMECYLKNKKPENKNVPKEHRCKLCGKGQDEVIFSIHSGNGKHRARCIDCSRITMRKVEKITKERKNELKELFRKYFERTKDE